MTLKSYVSKSFSTGNSAFLIRVATAFAARVASSTSVRRSSNWANVWSDAAASRASISNSRPIVGRRSCRKWAFSNSVVTSAIGGFLSDERLRAGIGSGEGHGDGAPGGVVAQELVKAAQVGERDVDLGRRGRLGTGRRAASVHGLDRGERPRPLDHGLGAVEVLAAARL